MLRSAEVTVSGRTVLLTFDEDLDGDSQPLIERFAVKVDGAALTLGGGSAFVVLDTVGFSLPEPDRVAVGQTVTVSYTDPTTGDDEDSVIQDLAGNDAASFTDVAATNRSAFIPLPVVTIEALTPTVSYNVGTGGPWDTASFRLTRSGSTERELRVELAWMEPVEALGYSDTPTAFVTFGRGESEKLVRHLVMDIDGNGDPVASITFKLKAHPDYEVSEPGSASVSVSVPGQQTSRDESSTPDALPSISVGDGLAREGIDADVGFAVTLDRPSDDTVTVDWTTVDGTAHAETDYEAADGTLRFAPGETVKTIIVTVLGDEIDEGTETFTVALSNATGARIEDGDGTGTIQNTGPLPQAWLARFGRTVAGHVVDAVGDRLADKGAHGSRVTVGGRQLAPGSGPAGFGFGDDRPAAGGLAGQGLPPGSSFRLSLGGDGDGESAAGNRWTLWGQAASSRFAGSAGGLALDGDATTVTVGADAEWNRLLAGVALAQGSGSGSFRDRPVSGQGNRTDVRLESSITSVHPYLRYQASERLSVWGLLGYGTGELTLHRDGAAQATADTTMRMAAVGARSVLLDGSETDGPELALRTDAMLMRIDSDAATGAGGNLAASEADAGRARLVLEGSQDFAMDGGEILTPSLALGMRLDSGDAETGTGIEASGGLRLFNPRTGLAVDAKLHGLLSHSDRDYSEWGANASLRYSPDASGRGVSLTLAPGWGAADGGPERLWAFDPADGFGAGGGFGNAGRLHAEAGYGVAAFGGRGVMTPFAGLTLSQTGGSTLRSGIRWALGRDLALAVEGTRREPAHGGGPDHAVGLSASVRW